MALENNTGELPRFEPMIPATPAERVVSAGSRLRGILGSLPMSNVDYLERTGGSIGMVKDFNRVFDEFRSALLETARLAGNTNVEEAVEAVNRFFPPYKARVDINEI